MNCMKSASCCAVSPTSWVCVWERGKVRVCLRSLRAASGGPRDRGAMWCSDVTNEGRGRRTASDHGLTDIIFLLFLFSPAAASPLGEEDSIV